MITTQPNSEYSALCRQFLALRTLANSQIHTISTLRKRLDEQMQCNNKDELESQRQANAQLSHDVAMLEAALVTNQQQSIERFVNAVIETGELSGSDARFLRQFADEFLSPETEELCQK